MAAKPFRGFTPVPGSARQYRNTSGETISRREYDNRRAQAAGWRNRYELEQFRKRIAGSDWLGDIYAHTGKGPTWQHYADIKEVQDRRKAIKDRFGEGKHSEMDSKDPLLVAVGGPLERLLDASGKRTPNGRPVGSS